MSDSPQGPAFRVAWVNSTGVGRVTSIVKPLFSVLIVAMPLRTCGRIQGARRHHVGALCKVARPTFVAGSDRPARMARMLLTWSSRPRMLVGIKGGRIAYLRQRMKPSLFLRGGLSTPTVGSAFTSPALCAHLNRPRIASRKCRWCGALAPFLAGEDRGLGDPCVGLVTSRLDHARKDVVATSPRGG